MGQMTQQTVSQNQMQGQYCVRTTSLSSRPNWGNTK